MTAALRAENFYAVILDDTYGFAEAITYHPIAAGAAPRTILAIIRPTAETEEPGFVLRDVERLTVSVGRDESHTKGGVNTPAVGDRIQRATDPDPLDPSAHLPAFTGRIIGQTAHSYVLEFERPVARQINAQPRNP